MRNIYLDYAAATPVDKQVLAAMEPYFAAEFYNPSANYLHAKKVRQALERARSDVAIILGCKPAEVIFTAGATEANNLAIQGIMRQYPDGEILVGAIEHDSVLGPAGLFKARKIPVSREGLIILNKLSSLINGKTILVSVGYVNNEVGVIQPLREIAQIISAKRKKRLDAGNNRPLWLHSDAAQAPNYLDVHVGRLGVDLMSLNGGKIYGPKQSGALYVKTAVPLRPLILGGGQESNLRSGTENVAGVIGLAAALKQAQERRKDEYHRVNELRSLFIRRLKEAIPQAVINGSARYSAPHILSITFPGQDNERLLFQLDEADVQAATGSACAASKAVPSHVLSAIGLTDEQSRSTMRFSFGRQTTARQINQVIGLLQQFTTV